MDELMELRQRTTELEEAGLRECEEWFRTFIRQSLDGIIIIDNQGIILEWNDGEERITGIPRSEAMGQPLWEVQYRLAPDEKKDSTFLHTAREKIFNGLKEGVDLKRVLEDEIQRPDGTKRIVQSVLFAIRSGRQMLAGGICRDITEIKRMEEELRRSCDELETLVQERTKELQAINEALKTENDERLRIEIELRESERRLRRLSTELLKAQEKERKLVAGEIHDSLGGSLAAIGIMVESALNQIGDDNPQARVALESVIPIIQGTVEEARRIQMSLRPSMLDDLGILATIGWFCRQFESTYSNIRIKREIDIQESQVPNSLKIVIFRVLQEAMNNIAKHSKADVVRLLLKKVGDRIEFVIEDNGVGFALEKSKRGFGLGSMKERTELSGGTFTVESIKGRGTVIHASWATK